MPDESVTASSLLALSRSMRVARASDRWRMWPETAGFEVGQREEESRDMAKRALLIGAAVFHAYISQGMRRQSILA